MAVKKLIALAGATAAVLIACSAVALAAGTKVNVRIEGLKKTLLAATPVHTHGGWIHKQGAPAKSCRATSAAGALDVATDHNWGAHYDKQFKQLEIISILGETHKFSSLDFWEVFVNNRPASVGACEQQLRRGQHLLFAAVPDSRIEYPIGIRAPRHATVNKRFDVHIVYFNAKGIAKPLNHARVTVHGKSVRTKANGIVGIKWGSAGRITISASRRGYIRAAPASVVLAS